MTCKKFRDYLKGQLAPDAMRVHVENCDICRKAYRADQKILLASGALNQGLEIPDLWPSVQKSLRNEQPVILKFKGPKWLLWAAAAAILILTSIWLVNPSRKATPSGKILSRHALEQVIEAEEKYQKAIQTLEELAPDQLEKTPEPLAQLYRNKLSLIDRQIENCKTALAGNPANSHIRNYLMAALQDKQKTLEELLKPNG